MAFSEVREYQIGDDVRNMDWNVTARTGTPYIKVFVGRRGTDGVCCSSMPVLPGCSGTMSKTKKDLTAGDSGGAVILGLINNDKVGALFFSTKVEKFIPPKKGRSHLLRIIREVAGVRASGQGYGHRRGAGGS